MKNNTNIANPVLAMMKPLPDYMSDSNRAAIRAAQEKIVTEMLAAHDVSMTISDMVNAYPDDWDKFPGYNENRARVRYGCTAYYFRRLFSNTCKRLEQKGIVISALVHGSRIYSLPITKGGKN